MKRQITKIETKGLDQCLIIRGLPEEPKETDKRIFDKLHSVLSTIMQGETEEEKANAAKHLTFQQGRRLGRYRKNRPRPISVELTHKQDAEFILENRFDLPQGIYVDREYPFDIERKRKTLLPVLRAAKRLSNFRKQSWLEDDKLVLKGRIYNVNTLNQLPEELNVFKVTSKENENTIGFFGEINPLSNFYPSSFIHEGVQNISSEQLIQANKAKLFEDTETYNEILCCTTSLECKNLSKQIRNVHERKWEEEALNACLPGICAKFYQNTNMMDTLVNKVGMKRIVECTSNQLWGTGVPLGDLECLDPMKWISQGILGQILECIHNEVVNSRRHFYHQPLLSSHTAINEQMIHQINPNLRHEADNTTSASGRIVSNPATGISTTSILDDPVAIESNTSASTTPTSDTTASDTDPGDSQSHYQKSQISNGEYVVLA